jgi:DNA-binding transcriptional regulator YiaG
MNIKKIREWTGFTQQEFAETLGMDRKRISAYETGQVQVPKPIQILVRLVHEEYFEKKTKIKRKKTKGKNVDRKKSSRKK